MHFLRNLLSFMLPVQNFYFEEEEAPPAGFSFVITNTNANVITSRNTSVIAKEY